MSACAKIMLNSFLFMLILTSFRQFALREPKKDARSRDCLERGMSLFYLQLGLFCLRWMFFACGGSFLLTVVLPSGG